MKFAAVYLSVTVPDRPGSRNGFRAGPNANPGALCCTNRRPAHSNKAFTFVTCDNRIGHMPPSRLLQRTKTLILPIRKYEAPLGQTRTDPMSTLQISAPLTIQTTA